MGGRSAASYFGATDGFTRLAALPRRRRPYRWLRGPILVVLFAVVVATIYRYAPQSAVQRWRWTTWGAGAAIDAEVEEERRLALGTSHQAFSIPSAPPRPPPARR